MRSNDWKRIITPVCRHVGLKRDPQEIRRGRNTSNGNDNGGDENSEDEDDDGDDDDLDANIKVTVDKLTPDQLSLNITQSLYYRLYSAEDIVDSAMGVVSQSLHSKSL
jgi:hypothetical protein